MRRDPLPRAARTPSASSPSATRQAAFRAGECNGGPEARAEAFRFEPRFPFADIRALLPPPPPVAPVLLRHAPGTSPQPRFPKDEFANISRYNSMT